MAQKGIVKSARYQTKDGKIYREGDEITLPDSLNVFQKDDISTGRIVLIMDTEPAPAIITPPSDEAAAETTVEAETEAGTETRTDAAEQLPKKKSSRR